MKKLNCLLIVLLGLGVVNSHAQVASHSFKAHVTKVGTTAMRSSSFFALV